MVLNERMGRGLGGKHARVVRGIFAYCATSLRSLGGETKS